MAEHHINDVQVRSCFEQVVAYHPEQLHQKQPFVVVPSTKHALS
jgi:hypothetical protein